MHNSFVWVAWGKLRYNTFVFEPTQSETEVLNSPPLVFYMALVTMRFRFLEIPTILCAAPC